MSRMKALLSLTLLLCAITVAAHEKAKPKQGNCSGPEIACAKTVTSAFAPSGDLWRLWVHEKHLYYAISKDKGQHFSLPTKVDIAAEKISSRGENRPKIGFDTNMGVYISWAMPLKKRFTALVRFTYSADGGKTFIKPITVNNDGLEIGHSFNEMLVSKTGQVTMTWLDGRQRTKHKNYVGSALYRAYGNMTEKGFVFDNTKLADNTCQCCRIAMTESPSGDVALMWRHIFADNIRDHAIMTFKQNQMVPKHQRATFDQWQINGCPHQGPGISIDSDNRYHMVWFNNGSKGKGLFYAYSDHQGIKQSNPISLGNFERQANHAHVINTGQLVDVIWMEFNSTHYQLYHQRSQNGGQSFSVAKVLANSKKGADRPFLLKANNKHYISWQRPGVGHKVIAL